MWSAADVGRSPASWMEGAAAVPDGLAPDVRDELAALADRVDPEHRIERARVLRA